MPKHTHIPISPNSPNSIRVLGAREHNLQNISLSIPRNAFVVITGVSGSGKSSLAFDTIHAEGQRRYMESLSAYARQFLQNASKPDVDRIDGLSPAIAIEQKTTSRNPRSTVGTVTEIHDYLRLLFARAGVPYSPATNLPIQSQTITQMTQRLIALPKGTRLHLLAPIAQKRKGEFVREMQTLLKQGFSRILIDGETHDLSNPPTLNKNQKHDVDVIVDRIVADTSAESRIAASLETAVNLADGVAVAHIVAPKAKHPNAPEPNSRILFSTRFSCPVSGFAIPEMEPRLFSFNSPQGACPQCNGIGSELFADPNLIVPDPSLSVNQGALAPWSTAAPYYAQTLKTLANHLSFSLDKPWKKLPKSTRDALLFGVPEPLSFTYSNARGSYRTRKRPFEGVARSLERLHRETASNWRRDDIGRFLSHAPCSACNGARLKPEALCVRVHDKTINQVADLTIAQAHQWFLSILNHLTTKQRAPADPIVREISQRLSFLLNVGLDYLTLSHPSGALSGGEGQRIRLASQIGSGLTGVLYALDEPSIGLHQRDNHRLLDALKKLRDLGNTLIVVEHDEDAVRSADHIVDVGPGAGADGGRIVAQGPPDVVAQNPDSLTGKYLRGDLSVPIPKKRRQHNPQRQITLRGASGHNLKNINASFPLGLLTCLTGVSGSGKSTLATDTLYAALARSVMRSQKQRPAAHKSIEGQHLIDKVINIDQSPIGRTPRSNPATYTGLFTPIRDWFAALPEARARGYSPGRFSFNVKGGRCEACQGDGSIRMEMHFLPDVLVPCDECKGRRFERETLSVLYRGKSIADVLAMTVDQAADFFAPIRPIRDKLLGLQAAGLGYITLGQPANTLSGGEAQRVRLARELARVATGDTFYILDEPTTGLHFHDVASLLRALARLVDAGNTVVVIEHNLDVIKSADHIIDLGPEGGDRGGEIVAVGTPEEIAANPNGHTGRFLKPLLAPLLPPLLAKSAKNSSRAPKRPRAKTLKLKTKPKIKPKIKPGIAKTPAPRRPRASP